MLRKPESLGKDCVIIEDPVMEPFFITEYNAGGFAVYERVAKGKNKKEYIRCIGYPSNFTSALKSVSKRLFRSKDRKNYSTVKDYLSEWEKIKNGMETLVDLH